MIKIENKLFLLLAFLMAFVVVLSNYLVQFPINHFGLENLLTYGALSYPVAFLITDLSNRRYGKNVAKKIVYIGFALGIFLTIYFSTNKYPKVRIPNSVPTKPPPIINQPILRSMVFLNQ